MKEHNDITITDDKEEKARFATAESEPRKAQWGWVERVCLRTIRLRVKRSEDVRSINKSVLEKKYSIHDKVLWNCAYG